MHRYVWFLYCFVFTCFYHLSVGPALYGVSSKAELRRGGLLKNEGLHVPSILASRREVHGLQVHLVPVYCRVPHESLRVDKGAPLPRG